MERAKRSCEPAKQTSLGTVVTINQMQTAPELESAAAALEVERMDPALTHAIGEAWKNLPASTKQWIQTQVRLAVLDVLRGRPQDTVRRMSAELFPQLYRTALDLAAQGASRQQLLASIRQLARSAPIPPALIEQRKGMERGQVQQYHRRQQARGRVPGRAVLKGRRWRESELEFELDLARAATNFESDTGEGFFTRVIPVPGLPGYNEGHEVLTRHAASGLLFGPDLSALLLGVIRPDRGGASYWDFPRAALHSLSPAAQRSHSLRRDPGTSQPAALAEIRARLSALYSLALKAPDRATSLEWAGEALHLIQDSYSGAHVERALGTGPGGSSPIRRIRAFYLTAWPPSRSTAPSEHSAPSDPRDSVWVTPGVLRRESLYAIQASREYLLMLLRHLASPGASGNTAELRAFLQRHFSF